MWRAFLLCMVLVAPAAFADDPAQRPVPDCPTLGDADSRLRARASFLLRMATEPDATNRSLVSRTASPNLLVALASVIAARAREEVRIWLIDELNRQICGVKKNKAHDYFPNTCAAVPAEGAYPGPSMNMIRTGLRRDLYAFPACHLYLRIDPPPPGPELDQQIDPYLIEALLVAAYRLSQEDSDALEDSPNLDPLPTKEDVAKLLVVTALARKSPWEWPEGTPFVQPPGATTLCASQTRACFRHLIEEVQAIVSTKSRASTEQIVRVLLQYLRLWDEGRAGQLASIAGGYYSAVRGDYMETALGFAADAICRTEKPPKLCARLPLIAEVASATTQEDLEAALDRVISPLGAWKRKQNEVVVSLNAMAGIAGGQETLKDQDASVNHGTYGLYMPIGIDVSIPIDNKYLGAVAFGATVLDLGGIVSYSEEDELEGGETSTAANADWSSLTSPGVYVAVALRNRPFRFGVSVSRTPQLRSVDFGDGVEEDVDSTRYMAFFAVDVSLLSF